MLEMPRTWNIYQEKLQSVSEASPCGLHGLPKHIRDHIMITNAVDAGCGTTEFNIYLAGFWSCIDLLLPCCSLIHPFWNENVS
jgi:hypothetical protein